MRQGICGYRCQRLCAARHGRGVTLIELLVATSAVALATTLLLPAALRAREQSKLSKCLGNLRGIAQAGLTYATEDQNENAIPAHFLMWASGHQSNDSLSLSRYAFGGKSGIGPTQGGLQAILGTGNYCGPATRPLNRTIYKTRFPDYFNDSAKWIEDTRLNLKVFECPADDGYPGGVRMTSSMASWSAGGPDERVKAYDYFGTSYAAQQSWAHYIGGTPHNNHMSNSVFLRPLSRVPNPARTILYQEVAAKDAARFERPEDPCDPCAVPDRRCLRESDIEVLGPAKGWHQKPWRFSQAFTDGRVEFLRVRGVYCEDVAGLTGQGCCGITTGENGRYMRIIIRGPRWQMDCLPSAPIVVPIEYVGYRTQPPEDSDNAVGPISAE